MEEWSKMNFINYLQTTHPEATKNPKDERGKTALNSVVNILNLEVAKKFENLYK
jgi:hypothetical protein